MNNRIAYLPATLLSGLLLAGWVAVGQPIDAHAQSATSTSTPAATPAALVAAAIERTTHKVHYDGSYRRINYPGGDVPDDVGVCTDVVIRSYRGLGIDLQQLVHEDMRRAFASYPQNWGLQRPDSNIDHRRVPNLQRFFRRHGTELAISTNGSDYQAGEMVTWMLPGNLPHIGIVSDRLSSDGERPLIVHNIGAGPQLEDMLFSFEITGRYFYGLIEIETAR